MAKIGIREYAESKCMDFYINLVNLIDDVCKGQKSELRKNNPKIQSILTRRNKRYVHDDSDYLYEDPNSWDEIINGMKSELNEVKNVCSKGLPKVLTIDYVSYDRLLFRQIHKLDSDSEEEILSTKYPERNQSGIVSKITLRSFDDFRQIRGISKEDRSKYGVIVEGGLNELEGLQNRQDSCIKLNILAGTNMWCRPSKDFHIFFQNCVRSGFLMSITGYKLILCPTKIY